MFMHSAQRGLAMGMKYGLVKGFRAYHSEEATPEMDETAMQGAIGIIIAVGGVLIALYIIAVVVGSISYAVTSGNIKLSPTWNSTITKFDQVEKNKLNRLNENRLNRSKSQTDGLLDVNIDSQAQATFNLAKPTMSEQTDDEDIKSPFDGLLRRGQCAAYSNYRGGYPYDRYWRICRSEGITSQARVERGSSYSQLCRTLNMAIA
jgi:hypothetical protein